MKPEYLWQAIQDPDLPKCGRLWESGHLCHSVGTWRVQNIGTGELSEERYCLLHAAIEARSRSKLPEDRDTDLSDMWIDPNGDSPTAE